MCCVSKARSCLLTHKHSMGKRKFWHYLYFPCVLQLSMCFLFPRGKAVFVLHKGFLSKGHNTLAECKKNEKGRLVDTALHFFLPRTFESKSPHDGSLSFVWETKMRHSTLRLLWMCKKMWNLRFCCCSTKKVIHTWRLSVHYLKYFFNTILVV